MKIDEIETALRESKAFKTANGTALIWEAIDRYICHRIDDTSLENDGDMLLFQWGTYDWGDGPFFEVGLIRQIMLDLEDPNEAADSMQQLSVTLKYRCTKETTDIGEGNKWCQSLQVVKRFDEFVKAHAAFKWAETNRPVRISIELGYV